VRNGRKIAEALQVDVDELVPRGPSDPIDARRIETRLAALLHE
jgi:hypothetical protein